MPAARVSCFRRMWASRALACDGDGHERRATPEPPARLSQSHAHETGTDSAEAAVVSRVRDRHSAYGCARLQALETDVASAREEAALKEMDADVENIRSAWFWAAEKGNVDGLAIAHARAALQLAGRFRCERALLHAYSSATQPPGSMLCSIPNHSRHQNDFAERHLRLDPLVRGACPVQGKYRVNDGLKYATCKKL